MRYNLLITKIKNNEIVLDIWYDDYSSAKTMFDDLHDGVDHNNYWLHIVDDRCNLIEG